MESGILLIVLGLLIVVAGAAWYYLKRVQLDLKEMNKLLLKTLWLCNDILNKIKR